MRKQLFNTFRLPKTPQAFRYVQQYIKQNPKSSWHMSSAMLFASFASLAIKAFDRSAKASDQANPQEPTTSSYAGVEFEPFNDEKYQEALNTKHDVLIFLNPDAWADQLLDQLRPVLSSLQDYQNQTKGRKIKFFTLQIENKEQLKEFTKKHNTEITRDTLLLLKNRFNEGMKNFTLEDWFENQKSLYVYFKRLQKLSPKNFDKFASSLKYLDSDMRVLLTYIPKDSPDYKKLKNEFGKLAIHFAAISGGDISSFAISDPETAKKLGLDLKQAGKLSMMSKSSKYIDYQKTLSLEGVNLQILQTPTDITLPVEKLMGNLAEFYRENYVFMKSDFDQVRAKYSLVFQVNENKIKKHELNECINAFLEAHKELKTSHPDLFKEFKIVKYKANLADKPYRIYIQNDKDRTDDLYAKYYNKKPLTEEQRQNLINKPPRTFVYEFSQNELVSKDSLINFIKDVKEGKVPEYFSGSHVPTFQKYSQKVVGNTYEGQVLNVEKDHVVFLCTKHCPGCKFLGKYFEDFALENIRNPDSTVQYNRINSERNTLKYLPNFPFTPVFLVLKKEDRTKPYVYKPQYAHPGLLKDFIDITVGHQIINSDVEKKLFENVQEKKNLFSNIQLEEVK